jgi:hypothetical protein
MNLRGAVVVLGAGASKGARVSGKRTPPLDADFLSVSAEYFAGKKARGGQRIAVTAWKEFKTHLKAAGLEFAEIKRWRLEQLSTFLEARASLRGMQLNQGRPRDYAKALESLKVVVCHVLRIEGGTRACDLHTKLFDLVCPRAVVSFNYDLIADQSLAALGLLDWRKAEYRGARYAAIPSDDGKSLAYKGIYPIQGFKGVPLLKLHGSIHYERLDRGGGFRLSGARFPESAVGSISYLRVPSEPYLIPPIAAKIEIKQAELRERWYSALDHLHDAPAWLFWGYSFPTTDTISQVLFRTALTRNRKAKPVIVVNPDASAAIRVREVCRKVKVEHCPSIERLLMDYGRGAE